MLLYIETSCNFRPDSDPCNDGVSSGRKMSRKSSKFKNNLSAVHNEYSQFQAHNDAITIADHDKKQITQPKNKTTQKWTMQKDKNHTMKQKHKKCKHNKSVVNRSWIRLQCCVIATDAYYGLRRSFWRRWRRGAKHARRQGSINLQLANRRGRSERRTNGRRQRHGDSRRRRSRQIRIRSHALVNGMHGRIH
jgi:hypothetical protein